MSNEADHHLQQTDPFTNSVLTMNDILHIVLQTLMPKVLISSTKNNLTKTRLCSLLQYQIMVLRYDGKVLQVVKDRRFGKGLLWQLVDDIYHGFNI